MGPHLILLQVTYDDMLGGLSGQCSEDQVMSLGYLYAMSILGLLSSLSDFILSC